MFRAYSSIGRMYVDLKKYSKAIQPFMESLQLTDSKQEKQWLLHDLAKCHQHLRNFNTAIEYCNDALRIISDDDYKWKINVRVVLAQIYTSLNDYRMATECYDVAFQQSKVYGDKNVGLDLWKEMENLKVLVLEKEIQEMKVEELVANDHSLHEQEIIV